MTQNANASGKRETPHTGPVIFSDPTARDHFLEHEKVITFRTSDRTTGDTWWRKTRTGPKLGNCHIEQLTPVDPRNATELEPHREQSGFDTVSDWQDAIQELNNSLQPGFLYRVTHRPL